MHGYPAAMRKLVNELRKLPSVGEKSAVRLAYHILTRPEEEAEELASALVKARAAIGFCSACYALSEEENCAICQNRSRIRSLVCVVEKPADVIALERSAVYQGLYHVLHGVWSPMKGVGPRQTKIQELADRIRQSHEAPTELFPEIEEVVLATSATVEGDATALYVAGVVEELGVRVSRIAQGLPKGGELEYADEMTLTQAIQGRRVL